MKFLHHTEWVCIAVLLTLAAFGPARAPAQEFPYKSLRIIVGFPPGGATDLVVRILQPKLGESFKQQVIVDSRPGANGVIGADLTAKAPPDGYTVHLATLGALLITPAISKVPYDPFKDFTPIGRTVALQNIFIVHPTLPARNIKELAALARARPGVLNYATSGTGGAGHLSGELFNSMANVKMVHIPYKGGGPAMVDLLAGHVEIFIAVISTAVPQVKAGKARALAVTGSKRAEALPEVPTVDESGLKGYESTNWYCLVGPANLPKLVVDRWHKEMTAVLGLPDIRHALHERGVETAASTPVELAAYMRSESDKWTKVAKAAKLQTN
jgi:tripartite-type tricarboxylate transporter receptor subunit TctC